MHTITVVENDKYDALDGAGVGVATTNVVVVAKLCTPLEYCTSELAN